jgi:hypothetical protein
MDAPGAMHHVMVREIERHKMVDHEWMMEGIDRRW